MQHSWDVLPEKFIDRLSLFTNPQQSQEILASFCVRKPSTFRANTLKISADDLEKQLTKQDIHTKRVDWYPDAFILLDQPQKVLMETDLYKNGFLYMQSLSSMIPPLVLDPHPEESILDMTAAPGSKTTQMAAMMDNTGEIIANDKSKIRLFKLKANLQTLGITNTKITQLPGQFLWKKFPQYFEKTLVDVPCSMEGRFQCDNEKTYRDWSTKKIEFLQNQQKFLLRSAISSTQVGGTIIYSTCTLAPEENEEVIDWILKKTRLAKSGQNAVELEEIKILKLQTSPGLTKWKNKLFDESLSRTVRIYPTKLMEGFFVAKLKKVASTMD
jgi:NOL1/NOP2/sun family putative RNA methylase